MAPHSFVARLAAAFVSVLAISGATTRAAASFDDGLVLHPLRPRDLSGLLPRATESTDQVDELSLQDKLLLKYGAPGEDQFHLAHLTLYAPNGLQVISMEIFEGLTSAVDCKGDDGILSLTFKTQQALDSAVKKWSWINEKTDSTFIMIANHDGCGPDGERQAYTIFEVEQVDGTLVTLLKARATPWEEVAGTFDIEFKAVKAEAPIRRRLGRRGFSDFIDSAVDTFEDTVNDVVEFVGDAFERIGDANVKKSSSFDWKAGTPNKRSNIMTGRGQPPRFKVDCVNCYSTGNVRLSGKVSVDDFVLRTFSLEASLSEFAVALELEAHAKSGSRALAAATPFNITKQLFSEPIPTAGIAVPGIFKLGAVGSLDVGVSTSLSGTANITVGATASLPQTAKVALDLVKPSRSYQSGFDFKFDPRFEVNSASVGGTISAAITPKLSIGAEIVKLGKLEAFVSMKTPEVSVSMEHAFGKYPPGRTRYVVTVRQNRRMSQRGRQQQARRAARQQPEVPVERRRRRLPR